MRKIFLFILVSMLLVGCGAKEDPEVTDNGDKAIQENNQDDEEQTDKQDNTQKEPSGYSFEHNGVKIFMNTDVVPVVEALGDYVEYFEAESCAFKGLDKTYTYPGFEITTYPMEGKDYISSVYVADDTVSTPEGIYLGSSLDDMITAYGDGYEESQGSYTYTKDDSTLTFIVTNDEVIAITYLAVVEGLQ